MEIGFNEWLFKNYGITSNDMDDDEYDEYYAMYQEALEKEYGDCSLVYGKRS